ncbi:hypothetical protein J6590_097821, partial [Homalodisca vitripennis]
DDPRPKEQSQPETSTPSTSSAPTFGRKKRARCDTSTSTGADYLKQGVDIQQREEDEYDKFAGNVAAKLRKMDDRQCIFAENLINQVLFQSALGKLQEDSIIHTPVSFITTSEDYDDEIIDLFPEPGAPDPNNNFDGPDNEIPEREIDIPEPNNSIFELTNTIPKEIGIPERDNEPNNHVPDLVNVIHENIDMHESGNDIPGLDNNEHGPMQGRASGEVGGLQSRDGVWECSKTFYVDILQNESPYIIGRNSLIIYKHKKGDFDIVRRDFLKNLARDLCHNHLMARQAEDGLPRQLKKNIQHMLGIQEGNPKPAANIVGRCGICSWKKNRKSITIAMGIHVLPSATPYWSSDPFLTRWLDHEYHRWVSPRF